MNESELMDEVKGSLEQLLDGLNILDVREACGEAGGRRPRVDVEVTIGVGGHRKKLALELEPNGYPRNLEHALSRLLEATRRKPEYVPVVVAPYISESGRRDLRDHGVNYLDLSGNAHLAFDEVLIVKSSPLKYRAEKKEVVNIFADKASLLIRELLAEPDRYRTVRELAEVTGNSIGWTSELLNELNTRGFLNRRNRAGCRPVRIEQLLNDWTDSYDFLRKNRFRGFFMRAEGLDEMLDSLKELAIPKGLDYALTLHAGARLVAPFVQFNACHIYVGFAGGFEKAVEFFVREFGLVELQDGGNFFLVLPYYKKGAFFQPRNVNGVRVVSDVQLYVDLMRFPSRGREQAERVLDHSGLRDRESWK